MKKCAVAGLSAVVVVLGLTACGHTDQGEKTCCSPPSAPAGSVATPTAAPDDGSGLRRNNSPSPTPPPTSARLLPHITLPHITWPKESPGAADR
ncbi:hypothetical protein [Nocardia spumae]|uniref:hypothetical protein n=1 Tax=Nocardia spumae TaxID=2887190 RepID=UPI001D135555|nr:hypothetical protein [Nocardia spumae]